MKLDTLASLIVDCQDSVDNDELIVFSAMPDNQIVRVYFCDPQRGVPILSDYADDKLAKLFEGCNTLEQASQAVAKVYFEEPLDTDEFRCVRAACGRAVLDATYAVAQHRQLSGNMLANKAIISLVVNGFQESLSQFQQ